MMLRKQEQMGSHGTFLLLLTLMSVSPQGQAWGWFSSSDGDKQFQTKDVSHGNSIAEFSVEGLNDRKAIEKLENAKNKLVGSSSCWQNAYRHLFAGCKEIVATDEKRSRFAWHLSDCFQRDSGRPPFPSCDKKSAMVDCLKMLNDVEHKVFLEFLLETNSICYQLQNHIFKHETERLVNELKYSAHYAEDKLETIEEKATVLLQNSNQIHDSLNSIDIRMHDVDQTAHNLEGHMDTLFKHSQSVYNQATEIAAAQSELKRGQAMMNDQLKEGMSVLMESYKDLGQEVDHLKNEAAVIENEINKVGDAMSSSMKSLQRTADDIGSMAGISLDKQQKLLEGQSTALDGLQFLTRFQTEALEESRSTIQSLAEYSKRQQEELLKRQEQLQQVHDHLVENSKSILAAQEAFESKQASMFIALDKLFALHNALLLESRVIKAFFVYFMSIFVIYMFTSTKQTYTIRPRLYIGLCATFLIEVAVLRLTYYDIEQQTWIINLIRSLFVVLGLIQLLYTVCTYRDYELLNHQMLLALIDKVNGIQRNNNLLEDMDMDSDIDWSSWVDTDLPENVDQLVDPDYVFPEEVAENSPATSSVTRRYNLRSRNS